MKRFLRRSSALLCSKLATGHLDSFLWLKALMIISYFVNVMLFELGERLAQLPSARDCKSSQCQCSLIFTGNSKELLSLHCVCSFRMVWCINCCFSCLVRGGSIDLVKKFLGNLAIMSNK